MVRIRLKRFGKNKSPFYRIVVADQRMPRDGRFIEQLGHYDPKKEGKDKIVVDSERVKYWISRGAKPSETVLNLLKQAGIDVKGVKS